MISLYGLDEGIDEPNMNSFYVESTAVIWVSEPSRVYILHVLLSPEYIFVCEVFLGEYIDLTTMSTESNMNSFNTESTTDNLASESDRARHGPIDEYYFTPDPPSEIHVHESGVFANSYPYSTFQLDEAVEDLGLRDEPSDNCIAGIPASEPNFQSYATSASSHSFEFASTVDPEVTPETNPSFPGNSVATILNNRKRPFEEDSDRIEAAVSAPKKRVEEPCSSGDALSSMDEEILPVSPGVASSVDEEGRPVAPPRGSTTRVRERSREVRLNEQENQLVRENEELNA